MRIPRQVSICGRIWKVRRIKDLELNPGESSAGVMDPETREIHLDAALKDEEVVAVFLHEFNHAILSEVGMGSTDLSETLEELIVENIARQYANTFSMSLKTPKKSKS